jgi:hypothetical protein
MQMHFALPISSKSNSNYLSAFERAMSINTKQNHSM